MYVNIRCVLLCKQRIKNTFLLSTLQVFAGSECSFVYFDELFNVRKGHRARLRCGCSKINLERKILLFRSHLSCSAWHIHEKPDGKQTCFN